MNFMFDDVIRLILMPAKIVLYILKTYKMAHIIIKFRDFSFSQLEINVGGEQFCIFPSPPKNKVQKPNPEEGYIINVRI